MGALAKVEQLWQATLDALPRGHTLPDRTWRDRHTSLLVVLLAHLVGLPIFGLTQGWSPLVSVAMVLPAATFGALAIVLSSRTVRSCCMALALLSCSAALVVLWHGTIEAHFHYFVMTAALALYEEWSVYGLAVGYVVLQHGLMSQIRSDIVFAHPMPMGSTHSMWSWAVIHGGFVLAQSVAAVVAWRATERARLEAADAFAAVRHQAEHDQLTGLVSRARFDTELRSALAGQHGGQVVGLLFIDLDDFKQTNDTLGHAIGDELLVVVARRLQDALRPQDVVGRFGGDEFVVCLTAADAVEVEQVADRIAFALRAPVLLADAPRSTTASIGIAIAESAGGRAEMLMRDADHAMYLAKREGKARRRTARAMRLRDRGAVGATPRPADGGEDALEVDRLLRDGLLRAVYQPVVRLPAGEVVGFEALARGPEGSPLAAPDALFAAATRCGRLVELDWACRLAALRGARAAGLRRPQVLFVNVEPAVLGRPCPEHLLDAVTSAYADQDADIVIEVTERGLADRPADLLKATARLRGAGLRVALDDVGAEVASLAVMPLVEPDVIKLDLRLVQQRSDAAIAEIVSAVNAEAERTGAVVLAEGIETSAHLEVARTLGATHGQGWLFGRPGPLEPAAHVVDALPEPRRLTVPATAAPTPFAAVGERLEMRQGNKRLLLHMTRLLEQQAFRLSEGSIVASAFQDASRFTPATAERYTLLADHAAVVVALGVGMDAEPAPGVRGAQLASGDPLRGEWSVVVIDAHFAGALVAVDLGDDGPDHERRFDFALTYDRALVIAAAKPLLAHLAASAEHLGAEDVAVPR